MEEASFSRVSCKHLKLGFEHDIKSNKKLCTYLTKNNNRNHVMSKNKK